jgi:hypothetical protein
LAGATQADALSQEFSKSAERAASANQRRLVTGGLANRQRGVSSSEEAHDEKLSKICVKDKLGWNPRVRAAKDCRVRLLALG